MLLYLFFQFFSSKISSYWGCMNFSKLPFSHVIAFHRCCGKKLVKKSCLSLKRALIGSTRNGCYHERPDTSFSPVFHRVCARATGYSDWRCRSPTILGENLSRFPLITLTVGTRSLFNDEMLWIPSRKSFTARYAMAVPWRWWWIPLGTPSDRNKCGSTQAVSRIENQASGVVQIIFFSS